MTKKKSTPNYLPKRSENIHRLKIVPNIPSNIIEDSQDVVTIQTSTNGIHELQHTVCIKNRILLVIKNISIQSQDTQS